MLVWFCSVEVTNLMWGITTIIIFTGTGIPSRVQLAEKIKWVVTQYRTHITTKQADIYVH